MKCCEQYAAALSAFVDGELSENEKEEVLSHVEHCQNCREHLSELMIVHTMFEEMPELDAPEGFSERVLERVHEEKRARSRHRRAWPRVLAACFALLVVTAAAWKLAPAMVSSNDSAADCNTSSNDTASAPAASGDTAEDFTYSYSAVQKEGVQADASPFDTYDTEDGADDRSADASGGYAIITLDVPAAAEFLHERGMAVYAENDEYVSYLVVAEAAHDLADAMELPEAERTALRQADDILIVEVAKTAPAVEEPAENTPAGEEESE